MAARFGSPVWVVGDSSLDILLADVPAVFIGDRLAANIPMTVVPGLAAAVFAALGLAALLGAGTWLEV